MSGVAQFEPVSWASTSAVRSVMLGNRSRDTGPEIALRRKLHAMGLRFRVGARPIAGAGTADIVFSGQRIAVFVDGCYWHGCPEHYSSPRRNAEYWRTKVERNRARDVNNDAALAAAEWTSVRVWEHEDVAAAAERVAEIVRRGRTQGRADV